MVSRCASAVTAGQLVARLEVYLRDRLGERAGDVQLIARYDGIVLRGEVRTYHAKQLAQQAVMGATALPIAAKELEVRTTRP